MNIFHYANFATCELNFGLFLRDWFAIKYIPHKNITLPECILMYTLRWVVNYLYSVYAHKHIIYSFIRILELDNLDSTIPFS